MHLISYIIYLFIHSDENKAKTASNSFHFKCIASKKDHTDIQIKETLLYIFHFSLIITVIIIILDYYYYFVDRQLDVVMPGSHIPEHMSRDSCIPPASAYRK